VSEEVRGLADGNNLYRQILQQIANPFCQYLWQIARTFCRISWQIARTAVLPDSFAGFNYRWDSINFWRLQRLKSRIDGQIARPPGLSSDTGKEGRKQGKLHQGRLATSNGGCKAALPDLLAES
jgi:hypothetical protein